MFKVLVGRVMKWMIDYSSPDMVDMVEEYLLVQDTKLMLECVCNNKLDYHQLAENKID